MMTVDEIMTNNPVTLSEDDTLSSAARLMAERGFRHIPIVDARGGLVGLVTQTDVLAASRSELSEVLADRAPGDVPISKFMTRDVSTVDGRASMREAALYLQRHKYGCLPVVNDGKLKGIVTDSDFVAVAINLLEQWELSQPEEL
jgi:CBS domain-containing protein